VFHQSYNFGVLKKHVPRKDTNPGKNVDCFCPPLLFCSLSISLCLYSTPNLLFIQASFSAVMIKSIIRYPEQTFQFCLECFQYTHTLLFIMDWIGIFSKTSH